MKTEIKKWVDIIVEGWPDPKFRAKFSMWVFFITYEAIVHFITLAILINGNLIIGIIFWLALVLLLPSIAIGITAEQELENK